jgi:ABC-type transport system substrate-binding protein
MMDLNREFYHRRPTCTRKPLWVLLLLAMIPWQAPAQPLKVLHLEMAGAETGFDPVNTSDLNTAALENQIFESLLTYDYLARPAKLVPRLAAEMPTVTDQGRTWLFHLKHGAYFSPDPVFGGRLREATAQDVAYTLMRFMDPHNRSPYKFLVDGKIKGLDERGQAAGKSGHFDYDTPVPGLEVVDRYTLRIHLKTTDYNFGHAMAQPMYGVVAREVIEAYAADTAAHPVGTGPYRLTQWTRSSLMVLEKNPNFRHELWNFEGNGEPDSEAIVKQMRGKTIPQIDRVEMRVVEEAQSAWLSFGKGELDIMGLSGQFAPLALEAGHLKPSLVKKGVRLDRLKDPSIAYYFFNQQDPNLGGMTPARIALRRAILMAINDEEMIRVIHKGQAVRNPYPIPEGVAGYDQGYRSLLNYDPRLANQLLDEMGYRKGALGYRTHPDGSPLVVRYTTSQSSQDRELDEMMKKSLDRIGIHFESEKLKFPEILRAERQCRIQFRLSAWIADYPDGDNFMQLWYGPHTHENNAACFQDSAWDALYEKTLVMPDSKERDAHYHRLARTLELTGITKVSNSHIRNVLSQPWVLGYKPHPIAPSVWSWLDLDPNHGAAP